MLVWLRLCAIAPYQTHAPAQTHVQTRPQEDPAQLGGSDDALVDAERALAAAKHAVAEEASARQAAVANRTTSEGKKKQTPASRDAKEVADARFAELQATEARLGEVVATLSAKSKTDARRESQRLAAFWSRWDGSKWSVSLFPLSSKCLKVSYERVQSAVSGDHDVWQWRSKLFYAFGEKGVQQPPKVFPTLLCNIPADAPWLLQAGTIYPAFPPPRVVPTKTRREYGPNTVLYLCGFVRYVQNRACDRAVSLFFLRASTFAQTVHTHTHAPKPLQNAYRPEVERWTSPVVRHP